MITTKPPISAPPAALKVKKASEASIANRAMKATGTKRVFRTVETAWPPITDVVERLSNYLSDDLQLPGDEKPLLHTGLLQFQAQMGNWQYDGVTTKGIHHSLAAMLCTVRGLSRVRVWRDAYQWDPMLGVSFTEFAQGQPVRLEGCGDSPWKHPDEILRFIGNHVMTPETQRTLSLDLRKLIREYEASCRP